MLVKFGQGWHTAWCKGGAMPKTTPRTDAQPSLRATKTRDFNAQAVHLTRTMQVNTLTLSQMADQKASILIGATFVVFSLSVTRLLDAQITASTLALAVTAFVSSLLAVFAVIPSLGRRPDDPAKANPLFFGHYAETDEEQWTQDLLDRLADDELLFRTMLRDTFQNGQVLFYRKYRFLTYAYRSFIFGVAVTMAIYFAEFLQII